MHDELPSGFGERDNGSLLQLVYFLKYLDDHVFSRRRQ